MSVSFAPPVTEFSDVMLVYTLMGLTSAQVEARCILLIVPNRTIKRQPKARLISAHTRDTRAVDRVTGSYAISGTWNMVMIAL